LLARDVMLRVLAPYQFNVDVIPEVDGGFTLWLRELDVGGHGATLQAAREDLLSSVKAYVENYLQQFDFYRHLPELARLEPYVLRLALSPNDGELIQLLFGESSSSGQADSA
jgi:hypothetical protein